MYYMEPMVPELKQTGVVPSLLKDSEYVKERRRQERRRRAESKQRQHRGRVDSSKNDAPTPETKSIQIWGKVVGYNKNKTSMIVRTDEGKTISVYMKNMIGRKAVAFGKMESEFPPDTQVLCEYRGKKDGYDQWYYIQIMTEKGNNKR